MLIDQLLATQPSDDKVMVEDVFNTALFTGNGTSQTITTGIDLSGAGISPLMQGGLVWIKGRTPVSNHRLLDTMRGANNYLMTNATSAAATDAALGVSFLPAGFTTGGSGADNNGNGSTYAAWSFRRAAKFFDIVSFTGTGSARAISHKLGVAPGMMIVRRQDSTANWAVWHRSLTAGQWLVLNAVDGASPSTTMWNNTVPTATVFTVGTDPAVNAAGGSYIAYVFGHDPLPEGIIQCGVYTGNGSATAGPVVNLGWEPQYVLVKPNTGIDWMVTDNARGLPAFGGSNNLSPALMPNLTSAEDAGNNGPAPTPTGFVVNANTTRINGAGTAYLYMAIRRGPMRVPTAGTSVLNIVAQTGASSAFSVNGNASPDMVMARFDRTTTANTFVTDRLRGWGATASPLLKTNLTDAEASPTTNPYVARTETPSTGPQVNLYLGTGSLPYVWYSFRRAPGFFDEVCYTGSGSTSTVVPHNLGVRPELIITKRRDSTGNWAVAARIGTDNWLTSGSAGGFALNTTAATLTTTTALDFAFTPTGFRAGTVGFGSESASTANATYTTYLFASCPGVSKIGSYSGTGTGTSQTIPCGFAPRFVMIKGISGVSDWFIFDTARGITAGNDPYIRTNTVQAEVTTSDWIAPVTGGFNLPASSLLNGSGQSFLYLAIA